MPADKTPRKLDDHVSALARRSPEEAQAVFARYLPAAHLLEIAFRDGSRIRLDPVEIPDLDEVPRPAMEWATVTPDGAFLVLGDDGAFSFSIPVLVATLATVRGGKS